MMKYFAPIIYLVFIAQTEAFSVHNLQRYGASSTEIFSCGKPSTTRNISSTALRSFPDENGSIIISAAEGLRQYVPLVVISGVLLDIVLGSPVANGLLAPMRRQAMGEEEGGEGSSKENYMKNPKERIDCDASAQAALDKARNSMELRRFLEENKTDIQRAADARDAFDKQAEKFDERMDNFDLRK